jgi:DNA repair exonuclease SbcCD ATPase subunit
MNEKAAEYSNILTNGEFNIEFITQKKNKDDTIKEVFDVSVSRKNGGQKYESLSSGEKRRVDLIIVFVLDELKRVNCLHNINVRFYDEVFDTVDELGTEKIIGLLNVISEKKQIFVVTHRNNMKDLFKNSITILKKRGFSELRRNKR